MPKGQPSTSPAPKKFVPAFARQPIDDSSLVFVPNDAVEGYQERIYRCVNWTVTGAAIRHHQAMCRRENIPKVSFSEAMKRKINDSILSGFLNENSNLCMEDRWEVIVPMLVWDTDKHSNEETRICFRSRNNIIDNLMSVIKRAVQEKDRNIIKRALKETLVLRLNDCEMTDFDKSIKKYEHLVTLSLCGNYLSYLDCELPHGMRVLEMQANRISDLSSLTQLPLHLSYIGLAKNLLTDDSLDGMSQFPSHLTVLDLADNDIYDLESLLDKIEKLPNLKSLRLMGNPCSYCACYAVYTTTKLKRLEYLDNRQVLMYDRAPDPYEPHPDDLKCTLFTFNVLRIMSCPMPPKTEKGTSGSFFIEMELPLLDSIRRNFLMFRRYESLEEMLPLAEDDFGEEQSGHLSESKMEMQPEAEMAESEETDIFEKVTAKNPYKIQHYTTFESAHMAWNKVMTTPEPAIKIFCPDLTAIRDTFRSTITLKLVYVLVTPPKKPEKKTAVPTKPIPTEQYVTIATIKCSLQNIDWSQPFQHFHWDEALGTDEAMHWGEGDLSALQYQQGVGKEKAKPTKSKADDKPPERVGIPETFTCHFSFGIVTISA